MNKINKQIQEDFETFCNKDIIKQIRLKTLEEVEKVIKEKASLKTEDKVVDIAILLFSEYILQQLNKMKEKKYDNNKIYNRGN